METEQEREWFAAQKIVFSEDLVAAAKQQLEFLAAVDQRRYLYDGPLLERAVHRYKTCWLPLLARYTESGDPEGFLVVPLDCEWIWHCHRLNPVQYIKDCEEFYGRILDTKYVQSSVQAKLKLEAAETWSKLYPEEPFELDQMSALAESSSGEYKGATNSITYDLLSAVKRQSSFYYQVCRPFMHDKHFLDESVGRYKGFIHLIQRNWERSTRCFCVPTYDIDLMWHSHQLHPLSYQKHMLELLGKVLKHDDTDSDRSKGKRLDNGFSETTKQWEETYGLRYWRAGAMYRGSAPTSLEDLPPAPGHNHTKMLRFHKPEISLPLQRTMVVEVILEVVGIRNLPTNQKGKICVSFCKKRPDMFFTGCCNLDIFSETGTKNVASFECEPSGDLVLSVMTKSKPTKTIGRVSISLEELMNPNAKLSIEKWFELKPCNEYANTKPIYLHVAASFTIPVPAPYALGMINPHPFSMDTCLFKLSAPTQSTKSWTHFVDYYGNDIISLQMRNLHQTEGSKHPTWKKSIFGLTRFSKKPHLLVEYAENSWSFKDYGFSLKVEKKDSLISIMLELKGFSQIIKLFPGARLEYELKNINKANVDDLMTVVEFSAENPYGKAIALLDFKTRLTKVREDWFVLPAIVLAFILSNLLKKGSRVTVASDSENTKGTKNCSKNSFVEEVMVATEDVETAGLATSTTRELVCPCEANSMIAGGCGNKVKSGGCGGGGCGSCGAEVSEATRLGAELAASEVVVVGA